MSPDKKRKEKRAGHRAAIQWGIDQRRIAIGGKVYPDGGMIVDGWPAKSPTGNWRDGDSGSHKKAVQVFPEVWSPYGVIVRRAVERLTERQREVLWATYVEGAGSAKRGRFSVLCGRNAFYDELDRCLTVIETAMTEAGEPLDMDGD